MASKELHTGHTVQARGGGEGIRQLEVRVMIVMIMMIIMIIMIMMIMTVTSCSGATQ